MKILYVVHQFYPYYTAGTEKFTYQIASMMQKNGNKVKVVSYHVDDDMEPGQQFGQVQYREYLYREIPVLEYRLQPEPERYQVHLELPELAEFAVHVLKKENPDIVHVCHPMRGGIFLRMAQEMNIPTMVTATDMMYICPKTIMKTMGGALCPSAKKGYQCNKDCPDTGSHNQDRMKLAESLLKKAAFVITPSQFLKQMILQEIPDLDIRVINHGLTIKSQKKMVTYHSKSRLVFGYMGTILEHKGVHLLTDAFKRLKDPHVKLKIYGNTQNPYAQKLVKDCKSDQRIEFCGTFKPSQIDEIYGGIDVAVIPSIWYENYPFVKREALVRGIPVIVTDLGALPEGIQDGINSFLFDLNNKDSLKNVLQRLISHPEKLNPVKKKISSFPITYLEQEAFQYLTLYRKLR